MMRPVQGHFADAAPAILLHKVPVDVGRVDGVGLRVVDRRLDGGEERIGFPEGRQRERCLGGRRLRAGGCRELEEDEDSQR